MCRELNAEEWAGVANLAVLASIWRAYGDPDDMAAAVGVFGGMLARCHPERFKRIP